MKKILQNKKTYKKESNKKKSVRRKQTTKPSIRKNTKKKQKKKIKKSRKREISTDYYDSVWEQYFKKRNVYNGIYKRRQKGNCTTN